MLMFKNTHNLLMQIERLKMQADQDQLNRMATENMRLDHLAKQLAATNARLTQEMILLRGAVKTEKPVPEATDFLLEPDVQVSTEGSFPIESILREARQNLHQSLQALKDDDLEESDRKAELVAATVPSNLKEWKEQHRAPSDDDSAA